MMRLLRAFALFALLLAAPAMAQVRATLSQSSIEAGDTVTLNIEVEDARGIPELAPLERDFMVLRMDSGRQMEITGGRMRTRQRFAVELRPRRTGQIDIPALTVGTLKTAPLRLVVAATPQADTNELAGQGGQPVFLETHVSDSAPFVQQSVLVTLRLHYAVNVFSGELQQPAPANASLVPFAGDARSRRVVNGQEYRVLERHYLLTPERSGELILPAAWFRGEGERQGAGGWFGAGRVRMEASSPLQRLDVRPIPREAQDPWLPAHQVSMQVLDAPQQGQVGKSTRLKLELHADGATAAQLPPLELMPNPQLQVFAEPAETVDEVRQGRVQSIASREFTLLPLAEGELVLQVKPVKWWDVRAQQMREASIAPIRLNISAGALGQQMAPLVVEAADAPATAHEPGTFAWRKLLAGILALAALVVLGALIRKRRRQRQEDTEPDMRALQREFSEALTAGDLPVIARLLPVVATPQAGSLSELRQRLASAEQLDAIESLQEALWGGGNAETARQQLRAAFSAGKVGKKPQKAPGSLLPPLYPEH